ncbi:hypothetical protein QBC46DRAFT_407831 [Diplogelasinospora grovesii]|uniref:Uncharacterized protein n=1 Tax=Diplogelasinospora grovesii TaxID=303347 RepID=A0AAN6S4L0_9PEZI|nr:hypothetical protein QBC46DRAFT_407831 [Diplogelasinospora grovesii]
MKQRLLECQFLVVVRALQILLSTSLDTTPEARRLHPACTHIDLICNGSGKITKLKEILERAAADKNVAKGETKAMKKHVPSVPTCPGPAGLSSLPPERER